LQISDVTRGYAVIAAPFDGAVTARLADPGTLASPGLPLMKIQGGTQRLEAVVPEGAIRGIRLGESVAVRLDAGYGSSVAGRVCEISPSGDAASHTFIVKIEIPRQGVSSGMFGRARFRTGSQSRILIPASAVWEREGIHYVYAVDSSGRARLRIVTTGAAEGDRIEILSGLEEGARIVTGDREGITDGARVSER
jgi:RND family efflux transporter MFP subunit